MSLRVNSTRRRCAAVICIALSSILLYNLRMRWDIVRYTSLEFPGLQTWSPSSSSTSTSISMRIMSTSTTSSTTSSSTTSSLTTTTTTSSDSSSNDTSSNDTSSNDEIPYLPDLRRLCDETVWTDGLWLQCHSHAGDSERKSYYGGLNNVRNRLQTCLRLAIESGSGLIIANVATRNQTHLKDLGRAGVVDASRFWDMEHLAAVIRSECPQLQLRFHGNATGMTTILNAPRRHWDKPPFHKDTFRNYTASILAAENVTAISSTAPVAISFGDSFIAWDYTASNELRTVRKDLFKTINYNRTLLEVSSLILASPQLQHGFIGIHLRAEWDWPHSFGAAYFQMLLYVEEMEKLSRVSPTQLRTVYISCGNRTAIQIFRDRLVPLGYVVHDKWTLLSENPLVLERLDSFAFDEKGVVEYQMLLQAEVFMGPVMSSMSSLIAFARTVDDEQDFFRRYIYPDSRTDPKGGRMRFYKAIGMRGSETTKLMVITGKDIMNSFP